MGEHRHKADTAAEELTEEAEEAQTATEDERGNQAAGGKGGDPMTPSADANEDAVERSR
ncbi:MULTISPECIES: hypothetical protein [Streptomyces]|uniref:Gliding motility protein n=1 Tax=Streptomyces cuspidosporus TaxID=66882 RepID=A0ABN3G6Y6_9ACTN|nr:hypothetical protein [Streptomyces sparsogenes]